jgi:hypothetical protein
MDVFHATGAVYADGSRLLGLEIEKDCRAVLCPRVRQPPRRYDLRRGPPRPNWGDSSVVDRHFTADPASPNQMNFSAPRDIPGNLAGGIGNDQKACLAGARPSPFDDKRHASGTVELTRKSGPDIIVTSSITYTVKDTVDLCTGDCGTSLEQVATVPLSQFEATGISGDVSFTVEFSAPSMGSFTIAAASAMPPAAPALPNFGSRRGLLERPDRPACSRWAIR